MSGPLSGKFGVVDGQEAVVNWNINDGHTPAASIASNTGGGVDRVAGIEAWDGGFQQNLPEPTTLPGAFFAFKGFTAPIDGAPTGEGQVYDGQAMISQTVVTWDFAGGQVISCAQTMLGHLGLVPSLGNAQDISISNPYTICGAKIEYSLDGLAWTPLENISQASLTLLVQAQAYVNSSTNCFTGRQAGPKDWTSSIVLDETLRAAPIPQKADTLWWRFWISDTLYYELKWGMVRDFTGITVNRETGAIIQQTINLDMDVSDGTVLGHVMSPSGVYWMGSP